MASDEQIRVLNNILEVERQQLELLEEIRDVIGSQQHAVWNARNGNSVVQLLDLAVSRLERIDDQTGRG